ncbi:hypothetical protein, conserved [Eimeria necatrix]|uniref:Transmembrane protein n=1 Tax=Eimeria necatrix TaxID=51315 RepID=U6MRL2_9EIME|nr:hypothetical protein, conserved [Eimeria necatrix]CDJ64300.1 hypothetical protein, conserved [Eimeria necatrix]
MGRGLQYLRRCRAPRTRVFFFLTLSLLLSQWQGTFTADPNGAGEGAGSDEVQLEEPIQTLTSPTLAVGRGRSPRSNVTSPRHAPSGASPSSGTPSSGSRKSSPSGSSPSKSSPSSGARQALKRLRRSLPKEAPSIQTRAVQEFISAELAQGDTSREDLMRAVITLAGEGHKFVEGDVPATRTHLLRSTANSLQLGPGHWLDSCDLDVLSSGDLRRLTREASSAPSLKGTAKSGELSPVRSESPTSDSSAPLTFPSSADVSPSASPPMALSPEPSESEFPVDASPLLKRLVSPDPPEAQGPSAGPSGQSELAAGSVEETLSPLVEESWITEVKKLLADVPSAPADEKPSRYSPETQQVLDEIPDLPGALISESTEELLGFSPYIGVPSQEKQSPDMEGEPSRETSFVGPPASDTHEEALDDLRRQVDLIIEELQQASEEYEGGSTAAKAAEEEPRDRLDEGGARPMDEHGPAEGERGASGFVSGVPGPVHAEGEDSPVSSEASTVALEETPYAASQPSSSGSWRGSQSFEQKHVVTEFRRERPRLWERTKSAAQKHKGMFLVAGGVVLATAIIAGLVFVHKKIGPRIPISSPLVSTIESKKCHVLVDFEKAHNLKGMGRVVGIEGVKVNNTKRILTVTYLEKPAVRSSRGWEMFKWLKHRLSFGKSLVRRVETLAFPESCMAASHSSFQVAETNGHVARMLVDLDLNPGPLTVPREVLENDEIDELLSRYEQDSQWKLYEDCVMHITVDRPFEGSPLVQVEPARGRVSFQNPELHHLSSELPRNCDWREPSRLRIVYKSQASAPLDVLLMMTAADPPLEDSVNLDRGYGDATLHEDSDDVLYDIRTLFEE